MLVAVHGASNVIIATRDESRTAIGQARTVGQTDDFRGAMLTDALTTTTPDTPVVQARTDSRRPDCSSLRRSHTCPLSWHLTPRREHRPLGHHCPSLGCSSPVVFAGLRFVFAACALLANVRAPSPACTASRITAICVLNSPRRLAWSCPSTIEKHQ